MEHASTEAGFSDQSSPENPWPETVLTEEEQILIMPGDRVSRVLHLFQFQKDGAPVTLLSGQPEPAYQDITILGVVGTLKGKQGLFAQCGWFGNYDLDWFWCRVTDIKAVELRSDARFRGGDKCIWVSSIHGDYALLMPEITYADQWEETLHSYGPAGRDARVGVWPTQGTRPDWWDYRWKDSWPWDKDPEDMDIDMDANGQGNEGWLRLGPRGDTRFPGEPLSHLHMTSPWVISPIGLEMKQQE